MDQSDALLASIGLTREDFTGPIEVYQSPVTHRVIVMVSKGLVSHDPLRGKHPDNLFRITEGLLGKWLVFFEPLPDKAPEWWRGGEG